MTQSATPDIAAGRLRPDEIAANFDDIKPPLDRKKALIESSRCYFCHDAPCIEACPTGIDIPNFIRMINTGNTQGAAGDDPRGQHHRRHVRAGLPDRDPVRGQACVRNTSEDKPVKIGMLQRYAVDHLMEKGRYPFTRSAPTGKRVAVVGGGPAGLSCAHRLAMLGHDVTIFDAKTKLGGLNEYGIAAYKTVNDFAQAEVDFILSHRRHHREDRPGARPRHHARPAAPRLRRRVPGPRPPRRQCAGAGWRGSAVGRRSMRSATSPICASRRTRESSRSAARSS